jgi:SAM-dependent methyltransferase
VNSFLENLKPGKFLEVGAGLGDFTEMILNRGFYGKINDIGIETSKNLRKRFSLRKENVEILDRLTDIRGEKFDYLFTFEVLEHIDNDSEELIKWIEFLKPGGYVLISVPAHQSKYSIEDKLVGHVRRYEKKQLIQLMNNAGLSEIEVKNYGFPLCLITRFISKILARSEKKLLNLSMRDRSIQSGIIRFRWVSALSFISNDFFLYPFIKLQSFFFLKDWGDGYVAIGKKD